jgi:hypothetical protein
MAADRRCCILATAAPSHTHAQRGRRRTTMRAGYGLVRAAGLARASANQRSGWHCASPRCCRLGRSSVAATIWSVRQVATAAAAQWSDMKCTVLVSAEKRGVGPIFMRGYPQTSVRAQRCSVKRLACTVSLSGESRAFSSAGPSF